MYRVFAAPDLWRLLDLRFHAEQKIERREWASNGEPPELCSTTTSSRQMNGFALCSTIPRGKLMVGHPQQAYVVVSVDHCEKADVIWGSDWDVDEIAKTCHGL